MEMAWQQMGRGMQSVSDPRYRLSSRAQDSFFTALAHFSQYRLRSDMNEAECYTYLPSDALCLKLHVCYTPGRNAQKVDPYLDRRHQLRAAFLLIAVRRRLNDVMCPSVAENCDNNQAKMTTTTIS